ncbi:MAG TPA: hypothetical protein VNI57_02790, partial [Candidatus Saccharimonadales bacterium]|nr:hypothetical protein [Candidatus Saccharimonadales bacterium]
PGVPSDLPGAGEPATEAARRAIVDCVRASCAESLSGALGVQARHSAEFMTSSWCHRGAVGTEAARTLVD